MHDTQTKKNVCIDTPNILYIQESIQVQDYYWNNFIRGNTQCMKNSMLTKLGFYKKKKKKKQEIQGGNQIDSG